MPTPLEFLFVFILIVIAVILVIVFVKWIVGARRTDITGFEIVRPGGGMRRGIIRIAEGVAIVFVLLFTFFGALFSGSYSYFLWGYLGGISDGAIFRSDPQSTVVIAAIIGAISGFLSSALLTAPLFTLSAIELNTRRTAAMLERLARPRGGNDE
jgi:hypothetical protein